MRIYVGIALALLAFAAAGCGGGGESTEEALTKAQFIKQGDAICKTTQTEKVDAVETWTKNLGLDEGDFSDLTQGQLENAYVAAVLPHMKDAVERLEALTPPAGDEKAAAFVNTLSGAVKKVEENPKLGIKSAPYYEADKIAQDYGFETCGLF